MFKRILKRLFRNLYAGEINKYTNTIKVLEDKVSTLQKEVDKKPIHGATLSREVWDKVMKGVPNSMVGDDSTAGAIGFKLGVTHLAQKIERELVI